MMHQVEGVVKGRGVGEDVGVQEVQERVQLVQVVLQRGAGQQKHELPPAQHCGWNETSRQL